MPTSRNTWRGRAFLLGVNQKRIGVSLNRRVKNELAKTGADFLHLVFPIESEFKMSKDIDFLPPLFWLYDKLRPTSAQ
jgi:hypothetical protein